MIVNHAVGVGAAFRDAATFERDVRELTQAVLEGRPLGLVPRVHPYAWNAPAGDGRTLREWSASVARQVDRGAAATSLLRLLDNGPFLSVEEWEAVPPDLVTPSVPPDEVGELVRAGLSRLRDEPHVFVVSAGDRDRLLAEGEYTDGERRIRNLRDATEAREAVRVATLAGVQAGGDVVARLGELAPRVRLIGSVAAEISRGKTGLRPAAIFEVLLALSDAAVADGVDEFASRFERAGGGRIHDESDTVKRSPNLRRQRLFTGPDGVQRECFPHVLLGGLRLHFCFARHTVWVGYLGPHLPTAKF